MTSNLKIVTIGGGSGMPVINQGLVKAGFNHISSIVTTFDSGGDTGRIRTDERGKTLAFSDYWRSLISLWSDGHQKELWVEFLRFRDGRNRNFGNIFFQFMAEKTGSLSSVAPLFSSLTQANLRGQVIPVSSQPADIYFSTVSGKEYCGEHNLDDLRMSRDLVKKIWLRPSVPATKEAIKAISTANVIIICPGSIYGSLLINFLPKGFIKAYNSSPAKKIILANLVSVANENVSCTQNDYITIFSQYLHHPRPFDLIVIPDLSRLPQRSLAKTLRFYSLEYSQPLLPAAHCSIPTLVEDIAQLDTSNYRLRHSVDKLATLFSSGKLWSNS